jgi:tRNA (guanine10-N2)-methyltransferase
MGPILMKGASPDFIIFEHWCDLAVPLGVPDPERYYLGRRVAISARDLAKSFDLKKRRYISTTSMDAELALVTANMALASPGKLFYDPFVGTGAFPLAAAQCGAVTWGSDIDGRAVRGDERKRTVSANFEQYGLLAGLGDMFTADLTNSPIRRVPLTAQVNAGAESGGTGIGASAGTRRLFDGIICDPPYGVREGLRVLGCRNPEKTPWVVEKGIRMFKHGYP